MGPIVPSKSSLVGIQGGAGSFNEVAALTHLKRVGIDRFDLSYLHTSANVLAALVNGEIDYGQFAICNTLGGEVEESVKAMAGYEGQFRIIERYAIKISHALMIAPEAEFSDVTEVVTHPQVLLQCKGTLQGPRYKHLKLTSCDGNLIDPARVAELLGRGELPKHVGTMSNQLLAEIYGLKVVAEDLQDEDNNETTFVLMEKVE